MKKDTLIVSAGRDPEANHGVVNPPVYHASTILYPSVAAMEASRKPGYRGTRYGRYGTPTTFALEDAVAALEGGARGVATGSGLAAIVAALSAFVKSGDHILMVDSAYGPARRTCDKLLGRFGVETTYYDPCLGAGIAALMRPNTRVVYTESPGSLTFEVQDIPAIAKVAHAHGAMVLMDNSWGTPVFFAPFAHGVDVSIQAATKYIVGHSDAMMGTITATAEAFPAVEASAREFGAAPGPDDCYLALRGLRTLAVRLARHQETGLMLARWLQMRPEVKRVLHPGLSGDPGHALWKRDFTGACGLFGFVLDDGFGQAAVTAMLDGMEHFGMGASWGGFESLILPADPGKIRTANPWTEPGAVIRIHAGLEDPADLIADLEKGFDRLNAVRDRAQR